MITLTASQGEYLKTVYKLSVIGKITVTSIAETLNCSKPSVVRALKLLQKYNMIEYSESYIKLTEYGEKYAKNIVRRDIVLNKFFTSVLEIEPSLAEQEVKNLQHSISCYTITKLENYISELLGESLEEIEDYCICQCNEEGCNSCNE